MNIEARLRQLERKLSSSSKPQTGYSAEFQAVLDEIDGRDYARDERQAETPAPTPDTALPVGCSDRLRSVLELLSR